MLSPQRLQEWTGNPEKYHHAEEERSAEEDADAAAQNLFLDLAESKDGRANVAPMLLQILNDFEGQANAVQMEADALISSEPRSVIFWDAVYTAAGLCVDLLESCEGFSFVAWYKSCLWPSLVSLMRSKIAVSLVYCM